MPQEFREWFNKGEIYYHDLDSFNLTTNCLQISLKDVFKGGFNTGYGLIREPRRIDSAAELTCILIQASQNEMFGGQSISDFDTDLACYVDYTRKGIKERLPMLDDETIEKEVEREIRQSMQAVIYNLNTMHARAGAQVPFSSVNIGLFPELAGQERKDAALICKCLLEEYEKGLGKGEQPIFPSIIFRVKDGFNANPEDEFYYLYQLACRVTARRMNPTYVFCDSPANAKVLADGCKPTTMG